LLRFVQGELPAAKLVFNPNGVICFPLEQQHRDQQAAGIRYGDDAAGNALAAIVRPGRLEIRFHPSFTDQAAISLLRQVTALPGLADLKDWSITYQGRPIQISS
jgi:hypothetical protein